MNRFLKHKMSEDELVENQNICALIGQRLSDANELEDDNEKIKLNHMLYERIFERYLYGPKENQFIEAEHLNALAEESYKIRIQLNHWKGAA